MAWKVKTAVLLMLMVCGGAACAQETDPAETNIAFMAETAILGTPKPLDQLSRLESRYGAYFERYDAPATPDLRVPYYEVLYQYARWLKHQQREAEALELLDRKEVPHLHAYIKHMLQSCRADLLVSLAEREAEPKKTELLDQAKKILDDMQW